LQIAIAKAWFGTKLEKVTIGETPITRNYRGYGWAVVARKK
jgi:hypothetical protein